MSSLQVYDPAMCCSTGVCGPAVDPKLVRFAADLEWLRSRTCMGKEEPPATGRGVELAKHLLRIAFVMDGAP